MKSENDVSLTHLLRRAGFKTTRGELAEYTGRGYESVVAELIHPERSPLVEQDLIDRYYGAAASPPLQSETITGTPSKIRGRPLFVRGYGL